MKQAGCFEELNRGLNPHFMLLLCLIMRGCPNCFGGMNAALPLLQVLCERFKSGFAQSRHPKFIDCRQNFGGVFGGGATFTKETKRSPTPARLIAAHCCHSVERTSAAAMSLWVGIVFLEN